jgi:endonuclease YncB( thermonuclease family)
VVDVTDGDTIEVRTKGKRRDVRLIGIDTPEVFGGRECGGHEASASMKRLLDRGDGVMLIRDRSQDNRDRYGRLLRYVERGGTDVGKKQIGRG